MDKREQITQMFKDFCYNDTDIIEAEEYADKILNLFPPVKVTPEMIEAEFPYMKDRVIAESMASYITNITAPQLGCEGWQPIETAPKDGTHILLYFPHEDTVIGGCWAWQGEGDWESGIPDWEDWSTDNDYIIQDDPTVTAPTHWMPLHKTPSKQEKECPNVNCVNGKWEVGSE